VFFYIKIRGHRGKNYASLKTLGTYSHPDYALEDTFMEPKLSVQNTKYIHLFWQNLNINVFTFTVDTKS